MMTLVICGVLNMMAAGMGIYGASVGGARSVGFAVMAGFNLSVAILCLSAAIVRQARRG